MYKAALAIVVFSAMSLGSAVTAQEKPLNDPVGHPTSTCNLVARPYSGATVLEASTLAAHGRQSPLGLSPVPISLRLGAMVSPRTKFAGGVDVGIPGFRLIPGMTSRVDLDVIVSANFGGVSTIVLLTFDQIVGKSLPTGQRLYFGGGIGPYFSDETRLGGKIFVGANFAPHIGAELGVNFAGTGDALVLLQARIGL